MDFTTYLIRLSHTPLTEAVMALYEASEGDARKYMKKVLISLGLEHELADEYGENWSEEVFQELRRAFVRKGCDVYYLPGLARIAYGELDFDSDDEDTEKTAELLTLVRFISIAHKGDFTRNLELIDVVQQGPQKGMKVKSDPLTFSQLKERFAKAADDMDEAEQDSWEKAHVDQPNNGYKIIELTDYKTAHKFYKYTVTRDPHTAWCYLGDEETFEDYMKDGNRLYLAVKPGFEKLKPGDPGYGDSMIGFDMGPVKKNGKSKLCVATNRYNHGLNIETGKKGNGDYEYDQTSLSDTLGLPVWRACPGHSIDSLLNNPKAKYLPPDMLIQLFPTYNDILNIMNNDDENSIGTKLLNKFPSLDIHPSKQFKNIDTVTFKQGNDITEHTLIAIVDKQNPNKPNEWFTSSTWVSNDILKLRMYPKGMRLVDKEGNSLFGGKLFRYVSNNHTPIIVQRFEDNKFSLIISGNRLMDEWFDEAAMSLNDTATVSIKDSSGKQRINVFDNQGNSVLGEWAVDTKGYPINPSGLIITFTFEDGTISLYDRMLKPFIPGRFDSVKIDDDGLYLTVCKDGKYQIMSTKNPYVTQDEWFDSVDVNSVVNAYRKDDSPYVLASKDGKFNWYSMVRPGATLFDMSFDKVEPLDKYHYFWKVWANGKMNLICSDREELVSDVWFDGDSQPMYGLNPIRGFKLNGRPVSLGVARQNYGKLFDEFGENPIN